jgi:hypothetical protein
MKMKDYASKDQMLLGSLYRVVSLVGFVLMAGSFALYVSGILPAQTPAKEVISNWHLDVDSYAEETGVSRGWAFLRDIGVGDNLAFGSLVFMAVAVIVCLAVMIPVFMRGRARLFAVIATLQMIVLILAASGIVSGT